MGSVAYRASSMGLAVWAPVACRASGMGPIARGPKLRFTRNYDANLTAWGPEFAFFQP